MRMQLKQRYFLFAASQPVRRSTRRAFQQISIGRSRTRATPSRGDASSRRFLPRSILRLQE
jgi:hypothetical protein